MKAKSKEKAFKCLILLIVILGIFLFAFQFYQLYRIVMAYKNGVYRIDLSNVTKAEETLESLQALSFASFNIALCSQGAFLMWFYALLLYFVWKEQKEEERNG